MIQDTAFSLRLLDVSDLPALLEVYRACEDFLALGPNPRASTEMVLGDLALSSAAGGMFRGICDGAGSLIGVADWIPTGFEGNPETAFIELVMIARDRRRAGLGRAVVAEIERRIRRDGRARRIYCGVQANNRQAQQFWWRCGYRSVRPPQKQPDRTTALLLLSLIHI